MDRTFINICARIRSDIRDSVKRQKTKDTRSTSADEVIESANAVTGKGKKAQKARQWREQEEKSTRIDELHGWQEDCSAWFAVF